MRDINTKRWLASLQYPAELYAPTPSISRDNRWVAAVLQGAEEELVGEGKTHQGELWHDAGR